MLLTLSQIRESQALPCFQALSFFIPKKKSKVPNLKSSIAKFKEAEENQDHLIGAQALIEMILSLDSTVKQRFEGEVFYKDFDEEVFDFFARNEHLDFLTIKKEVDGVFLKFYLKALI